MKPVIFGLSGPMLTAEERAFFADARPAGYILFRRNVETRTQLRALTDALREIEGRDDVAILVDQEGGPVSRLAPPEWPAFPAGPAFDRLYEIAPITAIEAARANAHAMGLVLQEAGITVDCHPILDVARAETTEAVACRAFGHDPMRVAAIGRATLEGLAAGGVVGVIKHMPGHGRATLDSHHDLPVVRADAAALEDDLEPFRRLAHASMGMTTHIVFEAWDADRPATMSPTVIEQVIRRDIGFDGWLMSDDIHMKALSGDHAGKVAGAIAAGCDVVLDCWSTVPQMRALVERLDDMAPASRARLDRAMAGRTPGEGDVAALLAKRDALFAAAGC